MIFSLCEIKLIKFIHVSRNKIDESFFHFCGSDSVLIKPNKMNQAVIYH